HERINLNDFGNGEKAKRFFKKLEEFAQRTKLLDYSNKGELKANQFVGIFYNDGIVLEIYPKIAKNSDFKNSKEVFLRMLKTLKDSGFEKLDDSKINKLKNFPLLEVFISLFLDEVEEIVKKGIKHNYITKEENQAFLKGKLKIKEQIKYNFIHKERFYVEYDEYLPNILENRVIKTTLLKLNKISNQKRIKKLLFVFDEVAPIHNLSILKNITLNRLTNYYENAIKLSKIFLFGYGLSTYSGDEDVFALFFDMNRLFESYVGEFFKKNSKNVRLQDKTHYLFENAKFKQLKPDIVIDDKVIIDTKWKIVESKNDISESDLYQMLAYAIKYNIKKIYLMYPKNSDMKPVTFSTTICNNTYKIKITFFDLNKKAKGQNPS
ncbi:MAG: McrC family protein, partial [Epsilonproteobacteria bacterium]|nr:McrC family protein [Campylobacterota bacterium]